MENLTLWAPVFLAGIGAGALIASVLPLLRLAKKRRLELESARARILAGVKEKHDQEILREIFRATDALNGEINKSLQRLRASTERLSIRLGDDGHDQKQTRTL